MYCVMVGKEYIGVYIALVKWVCVHMCKWTCRNGYSSPSCYSTCM